MGITTRSSFILLARLILKLLGAVCRAMAREKLRCPVAQLGTARLLAQCSCPSTPWALTNAPSGPRLPTSDGNHMPMSGITRQCRESHVNANE